MGGDPERILHLAHTLDGYASGGVGAYVRALAAAQTKTGAWVDAVDASALAGPPRGFAASWSRPELAKALADRVRRDRVGVVHVHHFSGVGFDAVAAAQGAGARVVVTVHDHAIACARGQLIDRRGAACPGPTPARCARCVTPDGLPGRLGRSRIAARMDAVARIRPNAWLTVAPHLGPPGATLCSLPLVQPPAPVGAHDGPARFLFVGSLIPTKGPDRVVAAFKRLPAGAATLDLVGAAPPWNGSTRYADALRAERVPGLAVHPPGPTAPWYARSDVLVFPSAWDEGCPLVLREAASSGLHVVASDVPGARVALPAYPVCWVHDGDWFSALAGCVAGVPRHAPAVFPTLAEHAAWLEGVYRG